MCGIVGYIGDKPMAKLILEGLASLEYRGYDSAGIAVAARGHIVCAKESGKLKALRELVEADPPSGEIGIGHTRWATHGEPSRRNAHPHTDCTKKIAVVHNGIIENHDPLRQQLLAEGHRFGSDTDTEVIVHLIEKYHLKQNLLLADAVRETLKLLDGSYAFCVISAKEPDRMVAARNGSPLVIGMGERENFVASDATAFLAHTKQAVFLSDHQMAVVSRDSVAVYNARGAEIRPETVRIDWDAKQATKEGFDHFMLKEIEEQPGVIERTLRSRLESGLDETIFDQLRFDPAGLASVKRILIQACGTSWHAALTGKFLLEGFAGIPTEVDVSSEFRYRRLIPQPDTLVLSITQSGETIDTLMAMRRGKERGYKTLSICNVLGSTIARESDGVIYTHAGPEIGVASTKAYTAQLAVLILLSLYWAKVRSYLSEAVSDEFLAELKAIPAKMKWIIERKEQIRAVAAKYGSARDFLFLGRGINYPNAHEGALKIKEIAYIHATGHPAGEMKHGPIALIDKKMPVVSIATRSSVYEKMLSNMQEVKARSGKVIAVATEDNKAIEAFADDVIFVPDTNEFLSPMLVALPLQYLAYYVAVLKGTDVDQPRNLAKSVTVE